MAELPKYIHYNYCKWNYGSGDFLEATGEFKPFAPTVGRKDLGDRWGFDAIVYYLLEQYWQQPFYVIKQTMIKGEFCLYYIDAHDMQQTIKDLFVNPQTVPASFHPFETQYDTYLLKYNDIKQ